LDELIKAGKNDEARALATTLEARAQGWFDSIAGGTEGCWLKQTVQHKLATTANSPGERATGAKRQRRN
jgi:hypothetical protein